MAITAASIAPRSNGGCACGAVRFVAEGEPYRVGLCHCFDCRKQHGAPFGAFALMPSASDTAIAPPGLSPLNWNIRRARR
jgi:hypothetical protein